MPLKFPSIILNATLKDLISSSVFGNGTSSRMSPSAAFLAASSNFRSGLIKNMAAPYAKIPDHTTPNSITIILYAV